MPQNFVPGTDAWNSLHPPFKTLPACFVPSPKHNPVPRFSYGIAFTHEEAIAFARKHKLLREGPGDKDGYWHVVRTVDHIVWRTRLTGAKLARPHSTKYRWMIELYTNENMYEVPYSRKERRERVARAVEMLGNGQPALWWWSWTQDSDASKHRCWESSWFFPQFVAPEYRDMISMEVWDEYFPDRTWHLNNGQEKDTSSGGVNDGSTSGSSVEGRGGGDNGDGGESGGGGESSSGVEGSSE